MEVDEDQERILLARLLDRLYRNPADEVLASVLFVPRDLEFGTWYAGVILGALSWLSWVHDHRSVLWSVRLTFLVLLALRAISSDLGRADDAIVRVPSAPLVRARAILTAAPPAFRALARVGAAAT